MIVLTMYVRNFIVVFFLFPGLLVRLAFSSVTQLMPFLVNTSQQCKCILSVCECVREREGSSIRVHVRAYMYVYVRVCVYTHVLVCVVCKPSINQLHF